MSTYAFLNPAKERTILYSIHATAMAQNIRAPKERTLTTNETLTSFENWRQTLLYSASLNPAFAPFLRDNATWQKRTRTNTTRGYANDGNDVAAPQRQTAVQKVTALELLLGYIANYAPVIARSTIVKGSTSLSSIWQALREHYGFHNTGAHFLDLANIHLEPNERPQDLYQRIYAFIDDNLMTADGGITHHGLAPEDEDMSPSMENMITYLWLSMVHPQLPQLVKQKYATSLRTKSLASIKSEISGALDSLLLEIRSTEEAKVFRSMASGFRSRKPASQRPPTKKSCPLCKEAGRNHSHFLSKCQFLPDSDKQYFIKTRAVQECHDDEQSDTELVNDEEPESAPFTRRVNVKKSPELRAFYNHHPVRITLDSGAETNMIKASTARYLGVPVSANSQSALQADGVTPLTVVGETHVSLVRDGVTLHLEALVVEELDVDILGGTPFLCANGVCISFPDNKIVLHDKVEITYGSNAKKKSYVVRRAQLVNAPSTGSVVWPGEYIEVPVPDDMSDSHLAIEPRWDNNKSTAHEWIRPDVIHSVGSSIRLINSTSQPQRLLKNEKFCQVTPLDSNLPDTEAAITNIDVPKPVREPESPLAAVSVDPDNILPAEVVGQHYELLSEFRSVFSSQLGAYNGARGPYQATVNMGPALPPQRKGRMPQYSRDKLVELQAKFDELECLGVFKRPDDVGVVAEYLNPSFLVKKPHGGSRLVTAFSEVAKYCKPQPSLMPDVDATLRLIARWRFIITTDLSKAFYQIPLTSESYKYCGVVTPFRGVRVYTRCAMGMPGSETALEELMCRVFGDLLQEGVVAKLADDLYCGGDTAEDALRNWKCVLKSLHDCNLHLSPSKTVICPQTTTILGWTWSCGSISASPHRLSTLTTCQPPSTVKGLRSFIGAYKSLARVLPNCAQLMCPLDNAIAGGASKDSISWTESLMDSFMLAQKGLSNHKSICLPRPNDQLWIVTDGSVKLCGIGATLYITRQGSFHLAGFYSAKLRSHQVKWLPCEVEALGIGAAIKHFSPYIVQSTHRAHVLTDSKPCVQAFQRLQRGEFSASPRVTTFLTAAHRYCVDIQHLAGSRNLPSDFASRNAAPCTSNRCQVCSFIAETEESVVRRAPIDDILAGRSRLPFASRSAWRSAQMEDPDLRRVHAHLSQGTRPSKKATTIKDVKRYLQQATLASDGLIVVQRSVPLSANTDIIVIPRKLTHGLLTALHLKLDHPTRHQLRQTARRQFFALDLDKVIDEVTNSCHTCASLRCLPHHLTEQSTGDPPDTVGLSLAADIIKRSKQLILVLRECATSYTRTAMIQNEQADTVRSALVALCLDIQAMEGPKSVIRTDPAPCFVALQDDPTFNSINIQLEIGRAKNLNKNPVAEKAIRELEEEIVRQQPTGGPISIVTLALATARLNSRIRGRGLSARELFFQRDQFTNVQLPLSDANIIAQQHSQRLSNHTPSSKNKGGHHQTLPAAEIKVGDVVYLFTDRDKTKARDRYLVTSIEGRWCYIRKFIGSQLRSSSYRVKLSECYSVPAHVFHPSVDSLDTECMDGVDDDNEDIAKQFPLSQNSSPSVPEAPLLTDPAPPLDTPTLYGSPPVDSSHIGIPTLESFTLDMPTTETLPVNESVLAPCSESVACRPKRQSRLPKHFKDFQMY